jgi:hypothetical protein
MQWCTGRFKEDIVYEKEEAQIWSVIKNGPKPNWRKHGSRWHG